jgi:AP-2 complex subunit alpha
MIRLTIRATDESVAPVMLKLMEDRLSLGISAERLAVEAPTRREISDAFSNVMVT